MALNDTVPMDSAIAASGIAYHLVKSVNVQNGLAAVTITVARRTNPKELCRLYGEFIVKED